MSFANFIYLFNKLACFVGYITIALVLFIGCLLTAMVLMRKYSDWRYGKGAGKER